MRLGLTLEQLGQELVCQSEVKQDYLVSSDKMRMETYGGLPILRVLDSAGGDCMEPLELNSTAHKQLGGYLRIPAHYYERMLKERPELLAYNVNSWLSRAQEVKLLRTLDGTARAMLSNRYWCVDHLELLQAAVPVIGNREAHRQYGKGLLQRSQKRRSCGEFAGSCRGERGGH